MQREEPMNIPDNDYGFSFTEDTPITSDFQVLLERHERLKEFFVNFLENLRKDPDKQYVFWPNREEKILGMLDRIKYDTY